VQRTLTSNQSRRARLTSCGLVHRRVLAGRWRVFTPAGIAGVGRVSEALRDPTVRGRGGHESTIVISLPAWLATARPVGRRASQTREAREGWAAP
jgi:hypothetical protein